MVPSTFMCRKAVKLKHIALLLVAVGVLDFFGVFTHLFESDFNNDFHYPLEGDVKEYAMQLRSKLQPTVEPINGYNFTFIFNSEHKCKDEDRLQRIQLVYIVKSAANNFDKRKAVRNSWGFQDRFSDVSIRSVFVLGVRPNDEKLQADIEAEHKKYNDIVQANFHDTYFNNTIKTMIGFRWAVTFCPKSKFYMFSDDDMYISTKNVLRFVRNPTNYPSYLEAPIFTLKRIGREKRSTNFGMLKNSFSVNSTKEQSPKNFQSRNLRQVFDFELADDVKLFAGFVFNSAPHRHRSSKWHVSLSEYPYHMWPPYVTAGAYILSREALLDMYFTSFFTKHFRFDDIYLGLVAKKADIEPFHCDEFHFYKKEYSVFNYRYVVASHGFSNPSDLISVWNEQKSAGNA